VPAPLLLPLRVLRTLRVRMAVALLLPLLLLGPQLPPCVCSCALGASLPPAKPARVDAPLLLLQRLLEQAQ
jgi:hypothetical protein